MQTRFAHKACHVLRACRFNKRCRHPIVNLIVTNNALIRVFTPYHTDIIFLFNFALLFKIFRYLDDTHFLPLVSVLRGQVYQRIAGQ